MVVSISSQQCFFVFLKESVVDLIGRLTMEQAVQDNGIAAAAGVELRMTALLQQLLRILQRAFQPQTHTQQPVAGWIAAAGKDLMDIGLADTGATGKLGFGNRTFIKHLSQKLLCALAAKGVLIIPQEPIQVAGFHEFLFQIIRAFNHTACLYKLFAIVYNTNEIKLLRFT